MSRNSNFFVLCSQGLRAALGPSLPQRSDPVGRGAAPEPADYLKQSAKTADDGEEAEEPVEPVGDRSGVEHGAVVARDKGNLRAA